MGKKKNVLTIKYKVRNTANDRGKYITPPVKRGKKKPIAKHPQYYIMNKVPRLTPDVPIFNVYNRPLNQLEVQRIKELEEKVAPKPTKGNEQDSKQSLSEVEFVVIPDSPRREESIRSAFGSIGLSTANSTSTKRT